MAKYTPSSPPPASLGGGWIWAGNKLPEPGREIEYINASGKVVPGRVIKKYGSYVSMVYTGSDSAGGTLYLGHSHPRNYWRYPQDSQEAKQWITDRLPEVGARVEVSSYSHARQYGTTGTIIDHKENNWARRVVFHPDDYKTPDQGYFLSFGSKWRYLDGPSEETPQQEGDHMSFSTQSAKAPGGYRGQVISQHNGEVIWESEIFSDKKDDDGNTVRTGSQLASDAANNKVAEVERALFASK